MRVHGVPSSDGVVRTYLFWCPGCQEPHPYRVALHPNEGQNCPVWSWNGSIEAPTFTPSLLVNGNSPGHRRCHLFLTNGELQFCADSEHELAGKTIPCPEWDDDKW